MAIAALVEDHLQPCGLVATAQYAHGTGGEELALVLHAGPQCRQRRVIGQAINLHVVGLVRPGLRVGQARRPLRIVAEQQQPFTGLVQAPDRRDPRQPRAIETAVDGVAAALVLRGGHYPARFVEHQVQALWRAHGLAIDLDRRHRLANRKFRVAHDPAGHAYAAFGNPARGLAARAHAGLGQYARQAMADTGGSGSGSRTPTRCVGAGSGGSRWAARAQASAPRGAYFLSTGLVSAGASAAAGVAAGAGRALTTRTPRAFIQASNSSAVMRLPFWLMSKRQGVLSNSVCGL